MLMSIGSGTNAGYVLLSLVAESRSDLLEPAAIDAVVRPPVLALARKHQSFRNQFIERGLHLVHLFLDLLFQQPPMRHTFERVLGLRMFDQITQNILSGL